jgi:hypothetical protein
MIIHTIENIANIFTLSCAGKKPILASRDSGFSG